MARVIVHTAGFKSQQEMQTLWNIRCYSEHAAAKKPAIMLALAVKGRPHRLVWSCIEQNTR